MKRIKIALLLVFFGAAFIFPVKSTASREMENLDRGVVAIRNTYPAPGSVYIGWRMLATEPNSIGFNVYRNGSKINTTPITSSCNYVYASAGNDSDTYSVAAVINGQEQEHSDPVGTWTSAYLGSGRYMGCQEMPLEPRTGYTANDASVGDLDGDGEYELVIKRLYATDNAGAATTTNFHYIEAYELDGTLMWAIDLGPNNIYPVNGVEINPIVYDFDGDGRAEVVLRTTDGAIDGLGNVIGSATADYRSSAVDNSGLLWMTQGPEFISVFDGQTGVEIARVDYIERDPIEQWGYDLNLSRNAHRADKCMMTPAYLNGETPSLVICRGIYEKIAIEAWSFRNGTLARQWTFSSDDWPGYAQQGNHNLTVGDVDGDGNDEIVYASMCVDDNGSGLYTTGLGHGDALHMSDMIPSRPGLEVFAVHEHDGYGSTLRDAGTGEVLWQYEAAGDTGRGCAAHIDSDYPGYQMWSVGTDGRTYDATTKDMVSTSQPNWGNFLIWWDGDLQREILDTAGSQGSPIINKWNSVNNVGERLISLYNYPATYASTTINGTKSNPCLSGDLIGDWREEAIYPSSDHTKLYIYTTCSVANNRIYTLMHDSQYRTAIAWQCNQYNQPPHPSFYIGAGMGTPPIPDIVLVIPDVTPPATPTGLEATFGANRIDLNWADNAESDLSNYTVYRSTVSGSGYTILASNVTDSAYSDSRLGSYTTYYYVVTATDSALNESDYSDEAGVTTGEIDPTVEFWNFEDGVNGQTFANGTINANGSVGSNGTTMYGYSDVYGPSYTNDTCVNGGNLGMLSDNQDGYVYDGALMSWSSSSWTIELSARIDDATGEWETLVAKMGTSYSEAESDFYFQKTDGGVIRLNYVGADGSRHIADGTTVLTAGQWYGLAAVVDGVAGTITIYVDEGSGYAQDGQLTGLAGDLGVTVSSYNWAFFRDYFNGNAWDNTDGVMDNVRFSREALAPEELIPLAAPSDTDTDGLEDAWEMEHFGNLDQSGTDDPDADGYDNETEETNGTNPRISSVPPALTVGNNQGVFNLSWSSNHVGWLLHWNTNLMDGAWVEIPGSSTTNVYEFEPEGIQYSSLYFRLIYP